MGRKIVFASALSDVMVFTANQVRGAEQIGSIREENNGTYKYVAFSGTTAVAVGDVVCYSAYASDGNAVICDGANTALGAGVAMGVVATGTIASGATYYATGWVRIKGRATVTGTLGGSPSFGDEMVVASASAGTVTKKVTDNAQVCAYCYDATAKQIIADFPY